jgi:hypothetical protein
MASVYNVMVLVVNHLLLSLNLLWMDGVDQIIMIYPMLMVIQLV